VVPPHTRRAALTQQIDGRVRLRSEADDVASHDEMCAALNLGVGQDRP